MQLRQVRLYREEVEELQESFNTINLRSRLSPVKEFVKEEDLLQRIEQKKRYKTIVELTKVVKEVETTSVIQKMAVFPEEKREYVMSILKTEGSVVDSAKQSQTGVPNHSTPKRNPSSRSLFRKVPSKYTSNSKVLQKK